MHKTGFGTSLILNLVYYSILKTQTDVEYTQMHVP